jgi:hypothetical protein
VKSWLAIFGLLMVSSGTASAQQTPPPAYPPGASVTGPAAETPQAAHPRRQAGAKIPLPRKPPRRNTATALTLAKI